MSSEMPRDVSVRFTHASIQTIAELAHIDLLHVKGPAVDDSLLEISGSDLSEVGSEPRRIPRLSLDADVLVRPSQVDALCKELARHGWTMLFDFADGSAFEHAATMTHPVLAAVDIHRQFPGIGPDASRSFDRLWQDSHTMSIAGTACPVPSVTAQRLLLIVHAARGGGLDHPDIRNAWTVAADGERAEVVRLAHELGAEVALAAGTGTLDDHRDARGYELWKLLSARDASAVSLWAARVRAAPTRRAAARTALRLVLPNPRRMRVILGHDPTAADLARGYWQRLRWGSSELASFALGRVQRRLGRPARISEPDRTDDGGEGT